MTLPVIGARVTTPHGDGTVVNHEMANTEWPGWPPRMLLTGRAGVKLDTWPFAWTGEVAYYQPKEMK